MGARRQPLGRLQPLAAPRTRLARGLGLVPGRRCSLGLVRELPVALHAHPSRDPDDGARARHHRRARPQQLALEGRGRVRAVRGTWSDRTGRRPAGARRSCDGDRVDRRGCGAVRQRLAGLAAGPVVGAAGASRRLGGRLSEGAQPSVGRPRLAAVSDVVERASALRAYADETAGCTRCPLADGRTQVVFGVGNPDADLMFVGEAPGFHEDQQGIPFVGQAGKLLDRLLDGIALTRADVYVCNVIKCRPPGNRDPQPDEIEQCEPYLFRQIELIRPRVVATLGNFATKLLSGKPTGITRVHGVEQETTIGGLRVLLYPIYHPAAALYTPRMLEVLKSDFARLPELMGREVAPPEPVYVPPAPAEPAVQLGLF